ncbi:MAG: hypothetical protein SynsKO_38010 [Synoicihabitans sp.]
MRFLINFAVLALTPALFAQTDDLFVADGRFNADDVIWSLDLDLQISQTFNASNDELNLFHTTSTTTQRFVRSLDADRTHVYWVDNEGGIFSNQISDGSLATLYTTGLTDIRTIAVKGTKLYWHDWGTDMIYVGSTDGATEASSLASVSTLYDMAITDDFVFYTDNGRHVRKVSTSGGDSSIHFSDSDTFATFRGIEVYRGKIYVAQDGFPKLLSANLDGSNVTEIADFTRFNVDDIDIANGTLFVLDDGGSIGVEDRIFIFDLANMSQNGTLVSGMDLASGMAVIGTLAGNHDADSDGDFQISLAELLRVIELYNTRSGSTRTGAYRVNADTADGYEPHGEVEGTTSLERYHSADTDQNAQLSLAELLRVIELYNTRQGTTRTGSYRVNEDTADGFEPDTGTE